MTHTVLFDTDIGIDDAMALLFLHHAPEVELAAITTGFGNASVENTTRNALYVKDLFGLTAPVYAGAGEAIGPRLGSGYPDFVHGQNGLGEIDIPEVRATAEAESGAEGIVRHAKARPGEVTIVAVGRMTNLALALELCPELPSLVKEVIVMGGAFGFAGPQGNVSPVAEANIAGDPTAADRVFTSGLPMTIIGLDVTQQTVADERFFERLRQQAGMSGQFIHQISRYYLDFHRTSHGSSTCPIHDSSAVAYLLRPELFETVDGVVRVATEGVAMGQTIIKPAGAQYQHDHWELEHECSAARSVNVPGVLDLYLDTLSMAQDHA